MAGDDDEIEATTQARRKKRTIRVCIKNFKKEWSVWDKGKGNWLEFEPLRYRKNYPFLRGNAPFSVHDDDSF